MSTHHLQIAPPLGLHTIRMNHILVILRHVSLRFYRSREITFVLLLLQTQATAVLLSSSLPLLGFMPKSLRIGLKGRYAVQLNQALSRAIWSQ
jgi:hypothetical protein